MTAPSDPVHAGQSQHGLSLLPFRAVRPAADSVRLGSLLCPPYDVIGPQQRADLLETDPENAVAIVLPEADGDADRYEHAAHLLRDWVDSGNYAVDTDPALYVYQMTDPGGASTRGLVGAVELRDPADGVILPHENTMAGPVADRLALMTSTRANVEPIYLVYDGGGAASRVVADAHRSEPIALARTPDGIEHTLWAITDPAVHEQVGADLGARRALIADGHHRYATYRELQQQCRATDGPGPWDYGLTLLVDSTSYGPQVHAIHRVLPRLSLDAALDSLSGWDVGIQVVADPDEGLRLAGDQDGFAAVLADATRAVLITDAAAKLRGAVRLDDEPAELADLDVTVLHRGLVEQVWQLEDTVDTVGYAHSVHEAVADAAAAGGTAVLLRPTPVAAVAAVAAAGARMPRKSTLFTPKPASGLLMRRFADAG